MATKQPPDQEPQRSDDIGRIVNLVRKMVGDLDRYSKELERSFHLTGPQLGVLRVTHRLPEITVGGLSQRMYLHISTVSGIVDRLESRGYLLRRRSEEDRRVVHLKLTGKGEKAIALAPPSGFGLMMRNLEALPAAERRRIRRSLQTLHDLMKVDEGPTRPSAAMDSEFSE
jgi:MarR family transcriptional regulator, organic hydroperoxide resistance regulator